MSEIKIIVKPYDKIVFKPFKALLNTEVNEVQDIRRIEQSRTRRYAAGDGPNGDSFRVRVKNDSTLTITKGFYVHLGETLYLENDIDLEYNLNEITQGEMYQVVCEWQDVLVDGNRDSTIVDARVGVTSSRSAKELIFALVRLDTPYLVTKNRLILADAFFTGSISNVNPLAFQDLQDRRYDFSQHYVSEGLSIKSSSINASTLELILEPGSLFHLKRYAKVQDALDLKWEIPLPTTNSDQRVLLYYIVEELSSGLQRAVPKYLVLTPESSLTIIPLKLFEITLTSSGVIPDSINDIRFYEPITRVIATNRGAVSTLADFYALKPKEDNPASMRVIINSGWYYYKGVYNSREETPLVHSPVFTVGNYRKDLAAIDSEGLLKVYRGVESSDPMSIPEPIVPTNALWLYSVIVDHTIRILIYPQEPANVQNGEIKDLRPIIKLLDQSSNISVDNLNFSGTSIGGLSNHSERDLQEYLNEVDTQLTSRFTEIKSVGITPEDTISTSATLDSMGKIFLGHDPYRSGNAQNFTKVGIGVERDLIDPHKVVLKNTWDQDLRLLTTPRVLDSSYHTHAGLNYLEDGAEVHFRGMILDYNSNQDMALISNFVLEDYGQSKFIEFDASQGVPSHIGLKIDPSGGIVFTPTGYKVDADAFLPNYDSTKGFKDGGFGYGVYIDPLLSGLKFVPDGVFNEASYLALNTADIFKISSSGFLELQYNTDLGLEEDIDSKLAVKLVNPFIFDSLGAVSLNIEDSTTVVSKESYLSLESDSTVAGKSYLKLKVAVKKGLGAYYVGGKNYLSVLLDDPLTFNTSTGAVSLSIDSNFFEINTNDELSMKASGLGDGITIVTNINNTMTVKVNPADSFYVDTLQGIGLKLADPLYHDSPSGVSLRLESTNPTLFVNTNDSNSLGVKVDLDGGLESGSLGVRLKNFVNSSYLKYAYISGGSFKSGVTTGLSPSFLKYDYNYKMFTVLADPPSIGYKYGSSFGTGDKGHLLGGEDLTKTYQSTHSSYLFNTETWVSNTTIAIPLSRGVSISMDSNYGTVIAADYDDGSNPIMSYDSSTSTWITTLADLTSLLSFSSTRSQMSGSLYNQDSVCFSGGLEDTTYQVATYSLQYSVDKTSIISNTSAGTLASACGLSASFSLEDNYVHFIGGKSDTTYFRTHDRLVATTTFFEARTPTPVLGMAEMSSGVINEEGILFTGSILGGDFSNNVLVYNETDRTWRTGGTFILGLSGTSSFTR